MLRFIDLFAGIGGIRLAFESEGMQCVFSSEFDRHCQKSYDANFGERPAGDIREIPSDTLPAFDILCAGFPCQPFSISGVSKNRSLGRPSGFLDETRGTLFFEIARILRDRKPAAFFLENVKNLGTHDQGRTFRTILSTLEGLGYRIHYKVISSAPIVPQKRERIYIVGFRDQGASDNFSLPDVSGVFPPIHTILEDEVDAKYTLSPRLWTFLQEHHAKHKRMGNGFGFGLIDRPSFQQARTLSARYYKDGSEILIAQTHTPRRLTPRECARLMGFPDDFKIVVSDTQAYKQFGNSIVVPVVELIAHRIKKALEANFKAA